MRFNKGQALLEFILILPIFLLFLLGIIDFGRIIYEKNRLEGVIGDAVGLVNNGLLDDEEIEDTLEQYYKLPIGLLIDRREVNTIISVNREIDVLTPGLGIIISNPYIVEATRVIRNE